MHVSSGVHTIRLGSHRFLVLCLSLVLYMTLSMSFSLSLCLSRHISLSFVFCLSLSLARPFRLFAQLSQLSQLSQMSYTGHHMLRSPLPEWAACFCMYCNLIIAHLCCDTSLLHASLVVWLYVCANELACHNSSW